MAYTKTTWKDHVVTRPRTYTKVTNQDGSETFTPAPGEVTQEGTPINATNLNHIEDGIADSVNKTDMQCDLDVNAASNTEDGALYEMLTDIGWVNEVIDTGILYLKKLLRKLTYGIHTLYNEETVVVKDLTVSLTVAAGASNSESFSVPTMSKYVRAMAYIAGVSGTGSGSVSFEIHGSATGGSVYGYNAGSSQVTASVVVRCVYIRENHYKNAT